MPGDSHPREAIFTSDFVFATLANLINSLGTQMLLATMPVYVLAMGGSPADAGLVGGTPAFTALLLRPFMGWWTDRWMRRPIVLLGTACHGAASIVYILAGSIPTLLLGRVVSGLGISSYSTAANAYLADLAPPGRRAETVGIFTAAAAIGLILGPALGFLVVSTLDFHRLFYVSAALAFTAFAVSLLARERRPASAAKRRPWSPRTGLVDPDALPIAWIAFCIGIGFGTTSVFISIFLGGHGIANPGLFFSVQALALLFSRAFLGRVADRWGRAVVIVPGVIAMALSMAMLPLAQDFPQFMLLAALFGLGFGASQPATMALLIDRVRPERRGLATSTYYSGFDGGIALGSAMLGQISQVWGFDVMWLLAGACTMCGLFGLLPSQRQAGGHPLVSST